MTPGPQHNLWLAYGKLRDPPYLPHHPTPNCQSAAPSGHHHHLLLLLLLLLLLRLSLAH
jgi:hypothetical protein